MLRELARPAPVQRLRRLRRSDVIRRLVQETQLDRRQLIQPLFVQDGLHGRQPVASMPGVDRLGLSDLGQEAQELVDAGVRSVILFGIPARKNALGSGAYAPDGIIPQAVRTLKQATPELLVITDVCLCEYTDHGHCGVVGDGGVNNDATLELLAKAAMSHAEAGADLVAPSAMMDGQVASIRSALDQAGHTQVGILSYAAKYASAFYGPFREAADSKPRFGDRRGYQMNPANAREALREIEQDLREGADLVLVKPALPCLDVIRSARQRFDIPLGAYQVSGEYAMLKAAAERGWIDEEGALIETLLAIRRAGADFILTYFAKHAARILQSDR